jgi:hypothetical protein
MGEGEIEQFLNKARPLWTRANETEDESAERAVGQNPGKEGEGMRRAGSELDAELWALLATEREIPIVPPAVRERMLARAREALSKRTARPLVDARTSQRGRWSAAAVAVLVVVAAGGAAAYDRYARPQVASSVVLVAPSMPAPPNHPGTTEKHLSELPIDKSLPGDPSRAAGEGAAEELRLLERVRVAIGRENYAAALSLIFEHEHRFKNGQLVEEREALRVSALSGLGRREDARRAAATFEARFPLSPLLSTVSQMVSSS